MIDEEGHKGIEPIARTAEPEGLDDLELNMGFVLRTSLEDARQIERFLKGLPHTRIHFVKRSQGRLWIVNVAED